MGKSLMADTKGTHIVFAAGTGVLCYVDLVAHLALANLGVISGEDTVDVTLKGSSLRSTYPSSLEMTQSPSISLFEALEEYCNNNEKSNFELTVRLSKEKQNSARWNKDFIEAQLKKHNVSEIKRIWVCGPPIMDETFDRAFQELVHDGGLPLNLLKIEIM